jgi:hypothetical protein
MVHAIGKRGIPYPGGRKSMFLGGSLDLGNVLLGLLGVSCLEDLYVQQLRNEQTNHTNVEVEEVI